MPAMRATTLQGLYLVSPETGHQVRVSLLGFASCKNTEDMDPYALVMSSTALL
jgi:hypothetical protein